MGVKEGAHLHLQRARGASPTSEEALRLTPDTPTPSQKYRLEAKSPQATTALCFEPGALPMAEPGRLGTLLTRSLLNLQHPA